MKTKEQISSEVVEALKVAKEKMPHSVQAYELYTSYALAILVEVMVDIRDILDEQKRSKTEQD